jgi:hypothetical protein
MIFALASLPFMKGSIDLCRKRLIDINRHYRILTTVATSATSRRGISDSKRFLWPETNRSGYLLSMDPFELKIVFRRTMTIAS